MKYILCLLLGVAIGATAVNFWQPEPLEKIEYREGKTDTLIQYVHKEVEKIVHVNNIVYKELPNFVDTLPKVTVSTFKDSTKDHSFKVQAFSLAKVDSFKFDLHIEEKAISMWRVDTIELKTIEKEGLLNLQGEVTWIVGGFSAGLLIGLIFL